MDKVILGALVVTETGAMPMHIGIADGRIVALMDGNAAAPSGRETVRAEGLIALPGAIDAHTNLTGVHDDPAAEIAAGTRGAAKAGVTTIIDMPHGDPPVTSLDRFLAKRDLMAANAVVDFALWGGLDGQNLGELRTMHEAGAVALKGFMCTGRPDGTAGDARSLPMLDDADLLDAMREVAAFGGVIGLHAENHAIVQSGRRAMRARGCEGGRAHAAAQPEIAETEAIARALHLAQRTGVRLHIVHMSSPEGADLLWAAKARGGVSAETCAHYLLLDEDDLERLGGLARCGPPLRPRVTVDALWDHVLAGRIDTLASDHCPYPVARKSGSSIWTAAMGLTGIETTTPLFFSAAVAERGLSLTAFARMTATAPARIFGLYGRKGAIAIGFDADIMLMDPAGQASVDASRFEGQAQWSPFDGMACRGTVVETCLRGVSVYRGGEVRADAGSGMFLPQAHQRETAVALQERTR